MPIYSIDGKAPEFEDEASNWIAPDAAIIGDIRIGKDAGIWFGVVLRGDNERISIGAGTNVQEHVMMHTDEGFPIDVGVGCTIGHRAILHGCTVGDNSLIGMGAIVLNGARIGRNCLVGAGALVTEGESLRGQFPDRRLAGESRARPGRAGCCPADAIGRPLCRQRPAIPRRLEEAALGPLPKNRSPAPQKERSRPRGRGPAPKPGRGDGEGGDSTGFSRELFLTNAGDRLGPPVVDLDPDA